MNVYLRTSLLLPVLFVGVLTAAQSAKLNDRLTPLPENNLVDYVLAAGATRAVYQQELDGTAELYSVPLDGSSAPIVLTGTLSGNVLDFATAGAGDHVFIWVRSGDGEYRIFRVPVLGGTPLLLSGDEQPESLLLDDDAERVVYRAFDPLVPQRSELYSAPADGSGPSVKLSGTIVPQGGEVFPDVAISPDGAWVVYRADKNTDDVVDLYSVPIDGSAAALRLNETWPLGDVTDFRLAFDSLGAVYRADQDTDAVFELYAVRLDGTLPSAKRSGSAPSNAPGGSHFELAAGSDRLVWLSRVGTQNEVYSVGAIAGGTPVKLNPPLVTGGNVLGFRVSANGARVVYQADQVVDADYQLYSVPADGSSAAVQLTGPAHQIENGGTFEIAEGTGRALFFSDTLTGAAGEELYSVPLDGSAAAVRLHGGLPNQGQVSAIVGVLQDSTVLFLAALEVVGMEELFRVPIDGSGSPLQISGTLASGASVADVSFEPGAVRLAYQILTSVETQGKHELFSALVAGGGQTRLSPTADSGPAADDVRLLGLTSDGERALYLAAEAPAGESELHSVFADATGPTLELNTAIGEDATISTDARVSADGEWVVYRLTESSVGPTSLHTARVGEPRSSVRLDVAPAPQTQSVTSFALAPDSAKVVFSSGGQLYLVPIDGSSVPEHLDPFTTGISTVALSPDGAWVVYRLNSSAIRSLPLDGHQGPVSIGTISTNESFTISPDSTRVVHLRRNQTLAYDLYSAAIDGSSTVQLDVAPPSSVSDYRISPDGQYVAYLSTENATGKRNVYSVPTLGGTSVQLNGNLVSNGTVNSFAIDPSSSRVLYLADQDTDGRVRLHSAPIDGSAADVRVSNFLPADHDVRAMLGEPVRFGGASVVYFASDTSTPKQLFSAPIDGSAVPRRLDKEVVGGAFRSSVEITVDGTGVLYAAEQDSLEEIELYLVPIDDSAPPRVVSGPMVPGGDVQEGFVVNPDGRRVHYLADQDEQFAIELYTAWLPKPLRRANAPDRMVER